MSLGSMRTLLLLMSVMLWLVVTAVGPAAAQDEDGTGDDVTPVPTSEPVASPPVLAPSPSPVAAGTSGVPAAPPVATGVFADPLSSGTVFASGACPTGVSGGKFAGGGFALIVGGPCVDDAPVADVGVPARGITVWDGDIAMDFRLAVGAARASFALYIRSHDGKLIVIRLRPAAQEMTLYRREGETETALASRSDLSLTSDPEEWSRLALRVRGGEAWVLINDEPMLYATDVLDQAGSVGLQLIREGSLDDDEEVGVVFRDLTLSTLADADPARAPTYQAP